MVPEVTEREATKVLSAARVAPADIEMLLKIATKVGRQVEYNGIVDMAVRCEMV